MSRRRTVLGLAVAVLSLASAVAAAPRPAPEWQDHAPMGTRRTESAYAATADRIYVMSGLIPPLVNTPSVEVYDVAADSWSEGPPMPIPVNHAMAAAYDGVVYHFGGYLAVVYGATSTAFALRGGVWEPLPSMPETRAAGAAVAVDGKVYVIGGFSQQGTLATTTLVFDIASGSWSTLPGIRTAREHLTAVAHGRHIYAVGGRKGSPTTNMTIVERLDTRTGTWVPRAPMRKARSGHASAITSNGLVVALGGEAVGEVFDSAEVYDVRRNRWSPLPPLTSARTGLGAAAFGTRVFTFFGASDAGYLNITQSLDLR